MSEYDMRQRVVRELKALDAVSVENPVHPGTPDINYIEGWLELKWLRSWPVKEETPVLIPHYTQQQRVWLMKRWVAGGMAHLVLQVRNEWFIFTGVTAARHVGRVPRKTLIEIADTYFPNGVDWEWLVENLRAGR